MNKLFDIIKYIKKSIKNRFFRDSSPNPDILRIVQEIKSVQILIDAAENNFNNVTDSDSIDYYIYILKAYRVRYNKLVKELKEYHAPRKEGLIKYKNYVPSRPTKQILITEEKLS